MTPTESWQTSLRNLGRFDGVPNYEHMPPFRGWVEQLSPTGVRLALFASTSQETLIISKENDGSPEKPRVAVHPWHDGTLTILYCLPLTQKEEIPCSLADGQKLIERYMIRLVKDASEFNDRSPHSSNCDRVTMDPSGGPLV